MEKANVKLKEALEYVSTAYDESSACSDINNISDNEISSPVIDKNSQENTLNKSAAEKFDHDVVDEFNHGIEFETPRFSRNKNIQKPNLTSATAEKSINETNPILQISNNELLHSIFNIIKNLEQKIVDIKKTIQEHENILEKSLQDIYQEIYTLKKHIIVDRHRPLQKFPDFPLKTFSEIDGLEQKLKDRKYYNDLKTALTSHVSLHSPSSMEEHFKIILSLVFQDEIVKDLSWTTYPNKKTIGTTFLVDLIQCELI